MTSAIMGGTRTLRFDACAGTSFLPKGQSIMSEEIPTVFIVDDDPQMLNFLRVVVSGMGLNVECFASAEAFLDGYRNKPETPKCIVLDVLMPGLSGLGLQEMLASTGENIPVIMISGCADIPMAVKAMRAGAIDFLEKPISRDLLSNRIREAIDHYVREQRNVVRKTELSKQIERLSARQREVLDLLVAGERSKQIARQLGIGEKTVAKHRAMVLEKMQVDSVVDLVRLLADSNVQPTGGQATVAQCN